MGKLNLCRLVQDIIFSSQFLLVALHANVAMVNLPPPFPMATRSSS